MLYRTVSLLFFLFAALVSSEEPDLLVKTSTGEVVGFKQKAVYKYNQDYISFKGIPFAKPPIKDLRFKAPEPITNWGERIHTSDQYRNSCISYLAYFPNQYEDEDCLYLNVFVPGSKIPVKKTVMVYFYGGAFITGSANDLQYGAELLMRKECDVIYVSVNYRVGVFGFMNLDLPDHSGNMGLKDQKMALRWVKKNIHHFGGNPESITIFGESAGGASVSYHLLASGSEGLFNRAICMSGTAISIFALARQPNNKYALIEYAKTQGKVLKESEPEKLAEFMMTADGTKIVEYFKNLNPLIGVPFGRTLTIDWAPVIECKEAKDPFISQSPRDIYKSLKEKKMNVETLFGYTNSEYQTFMYGDIMNSAQWMAVAKNRGIMLPLHRKTVWLNDTKNSGIAEKIFEPYHLKKNEINDGKLQNWIDLLSDMNFVHHILETINMHAQHSKAKTLVYRFELNLALNFKQLSERTLQLTDLTKKIPLTGHFDETCYLFQCGAFKAVNYDLYAEILVNNPKTEFYKKTKTAIEFMLKFWTSFAKTGKVLLGDGKPLKAFTSKEQNFAQITDDGIKGSKLTVHDEKLAMWTEILQPFEQPEEPCKIL